MDAVPRIAHLDRDRPLVEAARRDPARFDALYRRYLPRVYSYAYYELGDHHAAEDATEERRMTNDSSDGPDADIQCRPLALSLGSATRRQTLPWPPALPPSATRHVALSAPALTPPSRRPA